MPLGFPLPQPPALTAAVGLSVSQSKGVCQHMCVWVGVDVSGWGSLWGHGI